jgi:hypothetical protein
MIEIGCLIVGNFRRAAFLLPGIFQLIAFFRAAAPGTTVLQSGAGFSLRAGFNRRTVCRLKPAP